MLNRTDRMQSTADKELLRSYIRGMSSDLRERYRIPAEEFQSEHVKRGLRNADGTGVIAGVTAIGSVQGYTMHEGMRQPMPGQLYYRGINMMDIVEAHVATSTFGFEEVAYLLLLGYLPTEVHLRNYNAVQSAARRMPEGFTEDVLMKLPSPNVMNKLGRAVMSLYTYDRNPDDISIENLVRQSIELIGRMPVIVANIYALKRHYFDADSLVIHVPKEELSVAENFLYMIRPDKQFTREEALLLDMMLILHAEHGGGNNSTFTCRVLSSTLTDTYAAIAGAINSLKGPLHGAANSKVMEMFEDLKKHVKDPGSDAQVYDYMVKIRDGKANDGSGKIYGLGHAVYTQSDPRAVLLKKYAHDLAHEKGYDEEFALMERMERQGTKALYEKFGDRKVLCANVDMYSGLVYQMLGIPEELFTPLFAIARTAGWCAHRIEEILSGGRIIRPAYRSTGYNDVKYVPVAERG